MAVAGAAWGQQMTARDMFYSAAGLVAPPPPTKKTTGTKKATGTAGTQVAKKVVSPTGAGTATGAVPGPKDEGPQVILASQKSAPLGVRYSILKEAGGGALEVDSDAVFRSGDRIRLTVMANDRAHLYIVQRGSSGNWGVLFPSPEINGGNNVIDKERVYEIPAGHWFAFDEQPGKERLFIVLSRRPEPNLEKMMYRLQEGEAPAPPAAEKPAKMLLAQDRPIHDSLVQRVRSEVYTRDLVFEKVDEKTPGEKKEKAVYVVNKTGNEESRVVADVTLNHQ
jgi:hypothetical protein